MEAHAYLDKDDLADVCNKIVDKMQELFQIYSSSYLNDVPFAIVQIGHMTELMFGLLNSILTNPDKMQELWECNSKQYVTFMENILHNSVNMLNILAEDDFDFKANPLDRRFTNKIWQQSGWYKQLKDNYLLCSSYLHDMLDCLQNVEGRKFDQIVLYLRNVIDAFAPSNFVMTNPEVIEICSQLDGKNIIYGWYHFLEDLVKNKGHMLNIAMTDMNCFAIGENIAITPGNVVWQNELVQLIQYTATTNEVNEIPILIVPPFINKYYILDLTAEKSLVKWLVGQGFTVFLLSWINPDSSLKNKTFTNYMLEGVVEPLNLMIEKYNFDKINLLGYCVGGTLLACAASYLRQHGNDSINSLTFLNSLVDFSEPGELEIFIDEQQLSILNKLMQERGYLDGRYLATTFNLLKPNDLIWPYFVNNYLKGSVPTPFDILFWNSDSTHQPAEMYNFYLRNFYLHNKFARNKLILDDTLVSLKDLTQDIFCVACIYDHITPWKSVYKGCKLQTGDKTFVLAGSGHVAGIVNPPSRDKYNYWINNDLTNSADTWFEKSNKREGSWWPYWGQWLQKRSGALVAKEEHACFAKLEKAPGSYVRKSIYTHHL